MFAYTKIMQGIQAVSAAVTDAYFNLVTLLLPGDGTNGAQNNTFLDSSTNNFSITRNGNTTQGTFSPFSQTGWSNYFGTGYLTVPTNAAFDFGSGDATIEAWIYPTSSSQTCGIFDKRSSGANYSQFPQLALSSGAIVVLVSYNGSSWAVTINGATPAVNVWSHIAVVRNGNTWTLYVNGTVSGTPVTASGSVYASTDSLCIGVSTTGGTNPFTGYISNARIVKGTAVYTSAFTPSTTPLTAITNTSLLTCQSNRFIDTSTNAFAITPNGTYSVQSFSPFAPTAAYSASTNGGSGYFDGTGDYLSAASNAAFAFGTGDFEVSFWFYPTVSAQDNFDKYFCTGSGTGPLYIDQQGTSNQITVNDGNTVFVSSSSNLIPFAWNHIVVSRVSTTLRIFLNGTQVGSVTNSTNFTQAGAFVGSSSVGAQNVIGYYSGFRVVKGSGVSSVTVPTAPPTAITNTQLLLNFTNAGITDATAKNDLETVGNAQISTTQSKFGGSSMYFDGTGDYLALPASQNLSLGSGNFTVEMWVYNTNRPAGVNYPLWDARNPSSGTSTTGGFFGLTDTNAYPFLYSNGYVATGSSAPALNTWAHIAFVKNSGTLTIYLNGTSVASASYTGSLTDAGIYATRIGQSNAGSTENYTGYIDDLRITKGYARYTANFTAPTAAFQLS